MKTLTILFLLIAAQANSQWLTDVRMTNDPGNSNLSDNNAWCIASNPFIVCIVWIDYRNGVSDIYYKRSSDGGVSWGPETRLTNSNTGTMAPSVAVSGLLTPTVHVVWSQYISAPYHDYQLYYRRSVGGINWGANTRLTITEDWAMYPSVAESGSKVHVVWEDQRDWNDIYVKNSMDAGVSWGPDIKIAIPVNNFVPHSPSVSAYDNVVHVAYHRIVVDGNQEIFYKRSQDFGITWGAEIRLTNASNNSVNACVTSSGSQVHVVWNDSRDGNPEIYYKRSANGGLNWGADTRLTNNSASSGFPSVTSFLSNVHIVWYDNRDGNNEIYYKRSTNGGVNWGADTRLTNNSATSAHPSVSIALSTVHVVWEDNRDGNNEIYYKRNPTGNPVGIKNINSEVPKEFSLGQNYPNPFNPSTVIGFQLTVNSFTSLKIYDILGKDIATLVNEELKPGIYEVDFNGTNYSSGVYYYRLVTEDFTDTKKMVLVK